MAGRGREGEMIAGSAGGCSGDGPLTCPQAALVCRPAAAPAPVGTGVGHGGVCAAAARWLQQPPLLAASRPAAAGSCRFLRSSPAARDEDFRQIKVRLPCLGYWHWARHFL